MALDKADWHYGGDFPEELPDENGATHIGMFIAWIIQQELEGEVHHEDEDGKQALEAVRQRTMTGRDFLQTQCDEKFWAEDLNDEGLAFAHYYYSDEEGGLGSYYEDYEQTLAADLPTIYHVEDTWNNYDRLKPVIDQRFAEWKSV
ncbi:hypothetical protein KBK19_12755 [Microvirga sp. STR05]|uniref:DUF7832 domain-containing protein n=1 Tax=Hymenobacter duratus TaxID=2771356 RepID=A0ABR8JJV2_9BACT|nr:hypothetical protein [Hymenobacter duratus]MBD2715906.1 hypothetical protein [Hymenobacter duratus]MBR7950818.1 hypothetical protein [Microvirga sp. STR05]